MKRIEEDKLSIDWQPIVTMAGHPHGGYLCLIMGGGQYGGDSHYIESRYFTYDENHKATFQNDKEAKGVIAFLIPRHFSFLHENTLDKIQSKIKVIKKEGKPNKKFRRLCNYIENLTDRMLRS